MCLGCLGIWAIPKFEEFCDVRCGLDESCGLGDIPVRLVSGAEVQEPGALLHKREEVSQETSGDTIPVDCLLGSFQRAGRLSADHVGMAGPPGRWCAAGKVVALVCALDV